MALNTVRCRFHQNTRAYVSPVCSTCCAPAKCKFQVYSFCHPGQRIWLLFSGSLKKTKQIKVLKAHFSYNIAHCSFFRDLRISQAPFTYVGEPVSPSANKVCQCFDRIFSQLCCSHDKFMAFPLFDSYDVMLWRKGNDRHPHSTVYI